MKSCGTGHSYNGGHKENIWRQQKSKRSGHLGGAYEYPAIQAIPKLTTYSQLLETHRHTLGKELDSYKKFY